MGDLAVVLLGAPVVVLGVIGFSSWFAPGRSRRRPAPRFAVAGLAIGRAVVFAAGFASAALIGS